MGQNTGGIVGAVVGGFIGFFVGGGPTGAARGAALGYAFGTAVDPPKVPKVEGPRLVDTKVQGGSYGTPITEVRGEGYVQPFMLWAKPIEEVATQQGNTTIYTPYLSCALLLSKGPIVDIKRVKIDGRVMYDASFDNNGSVGGLGSTFFSSSGGGGAVEFGGGRFSFRSGGPNQDPMALLQAATGVATTPAYRNRAIVYVQRLNLTSYGKRVPIFEFLCIGSGARPSSKVLEANLLPYQRDTDDPIVESGDAVAWYTPSADRIITTVFTSASLPGSNSDDGVQVEVWNPQTRTQESVQSHRFHSVYSQGQIAFDRAINQYWYRHAGDLRLMTPLGIRSSDDTKLSLSLAGVTLSPSDAAGVAVWHQFGEVWVSSSGKIHRLSRSAILGGASFNGAKIGEYVLPWGSESCFLYEHSTFPERMVALRMAGTPALCMYYQFGTDFSNVAIASAGQVVKGLTFDASVLGALWFYNYTTQYLCKADIYGGAVSIIKHLGSSTHRFSIDPALQAAVVYNNNTKKIEWVNGVGAVLSELDIATDVTLLGVPTSVRWVSQYAMVVVTWGYSGIHMRWYSVGRVSSSGATIADIISDKCAQVGIPSGKVDVSEISDSLSGITYDGVMSARSQIEPLKPVGLFDLGISNGKVRARKRGGSVVKTIKYSDLQQPSDGAAPVEFVYNDSQRMPGSVVVGYMDTATDLETNYQVVHRPSLADGEEVEITLPMAITADQARKVGEVALFSAQSSRKGYVLPTTSKHLDIEQYDPFNLDWENGKISRMIATKVEYAFPLKVTIEAVEENVIPYSAAGDGVVGSNTTTYPSADLGISLHLMDIAMLREADNYGGFYVVASAGSTTYASIGLYESVDNGVTYESLANVSITASGLTLAALPDFGGAPAWDYVSTVDVYMGPLDTLESYTDDQVYAGLGTYVIGNEVLQARDAVLIAARTYRLSTLLRGRKGTEWAIGTHFAGERVIPLKSNPLRIASSAINVARLYKAVPPGVALDDVDPVVFTNTQAALKPYAPSTIEATRDGSGNIIITWLRRGRIGTAWGINIDMPLDEPIEKFDIDIMSGTTVKRTLTVTGPFSLRPTVTYLAADQMTDFGGLQASVLLNIHPISSIVNRGYVGVATV